MVQVLKARPRQSRLIAWSQTRSEMRILHTTFFFFQLIWIDIKKCVFCSYGFLCNFSTALVQQRPRAYEGRDLSVSSVLLIWASCRAFICSFLVRELHLAQSHGGRMTCYWLEKHSLSLSIWKKVWRWSRIVDELCSNGRRRTQALRILSQWR